MHASFSEMAATKDSRFINSPLVQLDMCLKGFYMWFVNNSSYPFKYPSPEIIFVGGITLGAMIDVAS